MARPFLRLQLVQVVFIVGFLGLLGRAAQVQLFQGAKHAAAAAAERTERVELPARRGSIFDRKGAALALTQEVFHVGVAPNELDSLAADSRILSQELGVPLRTVQQRLQARWAYFAGPYNSLVVQPLRGMRGVHLDGEQVRFHPHSDLARSLLGHPAAEGRPASGIERVMDTLLAGVPGTAVVLRDRRGNLYQSPARLNAFPVPGHDVYLTLDGDLQEIIEQALTDALEQYEAEGGDMVVLDPVSGEILAIASGGEGGSNALTGVFEPGSTAKLFAAAALLTHRLVGSTDSVWTEEGEYDLDGRIIHDDHPEGWLDLSGVFQHSSNIGMVKLALRLSADLQYEMLRDFGLGTPTGVEYPSESSGTLKPPSQWSGTTAASVAMGYEVAVTALQLAQAYAAIANDGVMMQPTLIREVRSPEGVVVRRHTPQPVRRVVSPAVASELRSLLRGVVYPGGTGETAALTSYEVAGKTGTVRRAGPGGYIRGSYTASFVSMFPADDPQLVMVVKLDDPQGNYARLSAAPVTRRVLEQVLATQLGPLDRARLTTSQVTAEPQVVAEHGTATWLSPFPVVQAVDSGGLEVVPDVTGLTLRGAARELHKLGFRVQAIGWGVVDSVAPAPGDSAAIGSVVTVTASERNPPR